MEGPASAVMETLQATFPLSAVSEPQCPLATGPNPSLLPFPQSTPSPCRESSLSAPSLSGGASLPLWVLASLPSHTWAYRTGALSVPTAPMHLLSSASAQVLLPSEPCLLAAHRSESRGLHPPQLPLASAPLSAGGRLMA